MVTGDYGLTAVSLARRVGMLTSAQPVIVNGADFEQMDRGQLDEALQQEVIFARMAPEHKLRLVAALQERDEVVAVTGDGVNDAPALRKADLGISMGSAARMYALGRRYYLIDDDFLLPRHWEGRCL
jgi:magnesium-transporting ATPase (P-type)